MKGKSNPAHTLPWPEVRLLENRKRRWKRGVTADTHHSVASGAGQGSVEQQWASCAVEFSAAVVYAGRGWLIDLWWPFGWMKNQDVMLAVGGRVSFHGIVRL